MQRLDDLPKHIVTINPEVAKQLRSLPEAKHPEVEGVATINLNEATVPSTLIRYAWVGEDVLILHFHLDASGMLGDAPLVVVQFDTTVEESPYDLTVYKRNKGDGAFVLEPTFDMDGAWVDLI